MGADIGGHSQTMLFVNDEMSIFMLIKESCTPVQWPSVETCARFRNQGCSCRTTSIYINIYKLIRMLMTPLGDLKEAFLVTLENRLLF